MKSEESGSGFLSGFLLGGLVGAAVALLLTPRKGEDTMESLRERSIELRSRAEEAAGWARVEADDILTRGRSILDEKKHRVQEALEEGRESATHKKSEMMDRYRIAKETGEVPPPEQEPGSTA